MEMCVELLFLFNSAELSLKLRYDAQVDSLDLIPLKPICSWKEKDVEMHETMELAWSVEYYDSFYK